MINIIFYLTLIKNCLCYSLNYDDVYELGVMSYNVYLNIGDKSWMNTKLDNVLDISIINDSVKAYMFSNNDKSKNVIALKGTSIYFGSLMSTIDIMDINTEIYNENIVINNELNNETSILSSISNDKWNDNLFFSCCFNLQTSIKDCVCESSNVCCKNCYIKSLNFEKNYLVILEKIMDNVKTIIDINNSEIVFTGHSLGGMMASYLGIIYNKLAVTFESPGDKHYLLLSGIIDNQLEYNNIYHFGHNADPIFLGNCGSTCSLMGYYMNTKCHIGNTCLYDAKKELKYTESILNHRIDFILKNIFPLWETNLPECIRDKLCEDCIEWNYD